MIKKTILGVIATALLIVGYMIGYYYGGELQNKAAIEGCEFVLYNIYADLEDAEYSLKVCAYHLAQCEDLTKECREIMIHCDCH